MSENNGTTPDLIATLERIADEAHQSKLRVQRGAAPRGTSALQRIEYEAKDALARAAEREVRD